MSEQLLNVDPGYQPDISGTLQAEADRREEPAAAGDRGKSTNFRSSTGEAPAIKVKSSLESLSWASGEMISKICEVFTNDRNARLGLQAARQVNAMEHLGRGRRSLEGLGRVRLEIDEELAGFLRAQYGPQCLRDKDFLKFLERQYPQMFKVQCGGTKIQVGWTAGMQKLSQAQRQASLANPGKIIAARN